jgi:hypothetical protein
MGHSTYAEFDFEGDSESGYAAPKIIRNPHNFKFTTFLNVLVP